MTKSALVVVPYAGSGSTFTTDIVVNLLDSVDPSASIINIIAATPTVGTISYVKGIIDTTTTATLTISGTDTPAYAGTISVVFSSTVRGRTL